MPQTAKRLGIWLRYLFVSDLENDSLNLFRPTVEMLGQHMAIIFVANLGRNTTGLEVFESERFQKLLERYQVPMVRLGLFDLELKKVVDGRNPAEKLLTWGEARNYPSFGILGQQEIQTYLEDFYEQLDRAEGLTDLAFSQREISKAASGEETEAVPAPARKRHSTHG